MIHIISQPPNDEFTLRIFTECLRVLDTESIKYDAFYLWSTQLSYGERYPLYFTLDEYEYPEVYKEVHDPDIPAFWLSNKFFLNFIEENSKEDLILIGIKDTLNISQFNPWLDAEPQLMGDLSRLFEKLKNKKIILLTSLFGLEQYINHKNVTVVCWGGDITNQMIEYSLPYTPVEKNMFSDKTFLFLNRGFRPHRLHTLSYMFYKDLQSYGKISCIFRNKIDQEDNQFYDYGWKFNKDDLLIFSKNQTKVKEYNYDILDDEDIYKNDPNNNYGNLLTALKSYYEDTFIEIIPETLYGEKCTLLTEKTQNSILGRCFPIWISPMGTVKYLRQLGLDVFDDIVNHEYDNEEHPIKRLKMAIDNNYKLLTDKERVKVLWSSNVERFNNNIVFIQQKLYPVLKESALNDFRKSIK